jgi:hypothetical protein
MNNNTRTLQHHRRRWYRRTRRRRRPMPPRRPPRGPGMPRGRTRRRHTRHTAGARGHPRPAFAASRGADCICSSIQTRGVFLFFFFFVFHGAVRYQKEIPIVFDFKKKKKKFNNTTAKGQNAPGLTRERRSPRREPACSPRAYRPARASPESRPGAWSSAPGWAGRPGCAAAAAAGPGAASATEFCES